MKCYMLVGIPGSGKSTWIKQNVPEGAVVLSTDAYVEAYAAEQGKSYDDVWESYVKRATALMERDLVSAVNAGVDIYWDQTNLTIKARANKLRKIPDTYEKIAVLFQMPSDHVLEHRLVMRPGKTIPEAVMAGMREGFESPLETEGFNEVTIARNP